MKANAIPLLDWIKRLPDDVIDLYNSGVHAPETLAELNIDFSDLQVNGNNFYGYQPLKEKIAELYRTSPDHVAITPGTSLANFAVMLSLLSENDDTAIESPVYTPLVYALQAVTGKSPQRLFRERPDRYSLGSVVESNRYQTSKLVIITNPHNPSGVVDSPSTITKMADNLQEMGGWLLVDEVFLPFIENYSRITLAGKRQNLIVTGSLTKAWGFDGLRTGWVIGAPDLIQKIEYSMDYMHINQPFITDYIAWKILSNESLSDNILRRSRNLYKTNLQKTLDILGAIPDIEFIIPGGGISIFVTFKDGRDTSNFCEQLYKDYNVVVVPGRYFEAPDSFRISFSCDSHELDTGLNAINSLLIEN